MQYVTLDTSDIGAAIRCELGTGPDGELRYEKRGDYMVISPCVPLEGAKENLYMRCKRGTVLIARSVPAHVAVCTYTLTPEDHDRLRVLYGGTSITQEPTKKSSRGTSSTPSAGVSTRWPGSDTRCVWWRWMRYDRYASGRAAGAGTRRSAFYDPGRHKEQRRSRYDRLHRKAWLCLHHIRRRGYIWIGKGHSGQMP